MCSFMKRALSHSLQLIKPFTSVCPIGETLYIIRAYALNLYAPRVSVLSEDGNGSAPFVCVLSADASGTIVLIVVSHCVKF